MLPECCHKPLDMVENTSVQKEKINTVSRDLTIELVRCKEIKKNIQADKLSREEEIFFSNPIVEEDTTLSERFFPFHVYHWFRIQICGTASRLTPYG